MRAAWWGSAGARVRGSGNNLRDDNLAARAFVTCHPAASIRLASLLVVLGVTTHLYRLSHGLLHRHAASADRPESVHAWTHARSRGGLMRYRCNGRDRLGSLCATVPPPTALVWISASDRGGSDLEPLVATSITMPRLDCHYAHGHIMDHRTDYVHPYGRILSNRGHALSTLPAAANRLRCRWYAN